MKITQKTQDLDVFVEAILAGHIKVGEVIRQSELCQILRTSMSPLRELLVLLEELDLVEVKPRAGFKIIYPDLDFMRENMQFRVLIENHAITNFVEFVTDDWITEQIDCHKEALLVLETEKDLTAHNAFVLELDRDFHRAIVGSMKNKAISKAHEHTQSKLRIARQVHRRVPPRKINMVALQDHLTILSALKARDLDAVRQALDAHFTTSARNTLVGY